MQDNTILGAAINIFMQNMLVRIASNIYNAHSFAKFLYLHCHMKKSALHYLFVTVAGLTAALLPSNILAAPGDLFETDQGSNTIIKFTPAVVKTTFASGLHGPFGLAFHAGTLFESDTGSGTIIKFTAAGVKSTFASGLNTPTGLAFDASGNLFEADQASGTIFKFTPAGAKSTFASGLSEPSGLAFEPPTAQLTNISTRGLVQTGNDVMIGGFIIEGSGPKTVIVRAIGPELTPFGIPNALADPTLELHDGTRALIASNNNWQTTIIGGIITSDQVGAIQNSGHAPTQPSESAIIATLPPGNYTAIVRGVNNTVGVALVEVDDLTSMPILDNGTIKVGVDTFYGGGITCLSQSGSTTNLINIHDFGREAQQSYYSGPANGSVALDKRIL